MHKGMVTSINGGYVKVDADIKSEYSRIELAYHNLALKLETDRHSLYEQERFYTIAKMHVIHGKAFTHEQYSKMVDSVLKYKLTSVMGVLAKDILTSVTLELVLLAGNSCSGYATADIYDKMAAMMEEAKKLAATVNLMDLFHS
jgi:hypothetical protein